MKTNGDEAAFATFSQIDVFDVENERPEARLEVTGFDGLTKREYFAAAAMQGTLASLAHPEIMLVFRDTARDEGRKPAEQAAWFALQVADAMIAQLNDQT